MRALCAVAFAAVLVPVSIQAEQASPAARVPFDDCTLTHRLTSIYSLAGLPDALRSDLSARVGNLADRGQPYQSTDAIVLNGAPTQRFIRAVQSDHNLFVWYEQGGIAVRARVVVYDIDAAVGAQEPPAGPRFEANFTTFDLCRATDAYLDGMSPANGGEH